MDEQPESVDDLPDCARCEHPHADHHIKFTDRADLTFCHRLGGPLCRCAFYIGPEKANAYRIAAAFFGH